MNQPMGGVAIEPARGQHVAGILCMLAGCLLITLNDAATKWLTSDYPIGQIIFMRGILSVGMILVFCMARRRPHELRPHDLRFQLYRGGFFVATIALFTLGLKLLPLPVMTAVSFVAPIIMTALAGPLLGETADLRRWFAVIAGFAGVVLIVDPGAESWSLAALVPLGCALASALRDITTRQLTTRETTASILFITALLTTLAGLAAVPFGGWSLPGMSDWLLFIFVGASQLAGHFFLVRAFRLTPAVILAPFKYSMIVWAMLLAFAVWGEIPSLMMLAGAAIVVASGLYIFYRERGAGAKTL
jgi:drug/metabolite transporter (DMT)-like permease